MVMYMLEVKGLPPKKDISLSMWNDKKKPNQIQRLIELRKEAKKKIKGIIRKNIVLDLRVYIPKRKNQISEGDLDNYISGICDGLMLADKGVQNISKEFEKYEGIHPRIRSFIKDDCETVQITARKIVLDDIEEHYQLIIQGEEEELT